MPEVSNLFVVLMGIGTVFFGLICIILLCMAMSAVCRSMEKAPVAAPAAGVEAIPNRQAMIAAIAAAIAEEEGTDLAGIRILSVKKL